ncbi:uncharacterized protein LOC131844036 [Achroia grisella]|uniref:uncharacterized protein LOC131844036 n=1 Tax=Achroia grisella TaxID=688607 RepID=UPI0027D26DDC|nr:uncharacterized protein LOC131844036 [Achroia grisella]
METLSKDPILEFNSDTLLSVRKLYDLDRPGRMEEAINILEEWVKKQDHFTNKDFNRYHLERIIINNKGFLERVKIKLDSICTGRTLMPNFFIPVNVKEDFKDMGDFIDVVLPKLTPNNHRVYICKNKGKEFTSTQTLNYYKRIVIIWDYVMTHDYNGGIIGVADFTEANLANFITQLTINFNEIRQAVTLILECFSTRLKEIHIISSSKLIVNFVAILKTLMSAKLISRIRIHSSIDSLREVIPVETLPVEYGGTETSMYQLHSKLLDILSTKEYIEYLKMTQEFRTDENLRKADKFNDKYLGQPGTFRTLNVD